MMQQTLRCKLIIVGLTLLFALNSTLMACTGIFYADTQKTLAGNNEDWMSPFTRIWFIPASEGKYGRIYLGFQEGGYQGGMNDQGLFFDGFALKPIDVKPTPGKEIYPDNLAQKAMEECRTVEEVITLFERYDRSDLAGAQLFFADKAGNSAIIEAQTIIHKLGPYQLVTNFRQSEVAPKDIGDSRYCIARHLLENEKQIDIPLIRRILSATHQEGKYPTQYSNICDLKSGIIHLYYFHNYEQVAQINLEEELKKGNRVISMQSLFPDSHAAISYKKTIEKTMAERLSKTAIVPLQTKLAHQLAGKYGIDKGPMAGYTVTISLHEDKLYMQISPLLEASELHPLSRVDFVVNGLEEDFPVKFEPDQTDGFKKISLTMMGMTIDALKK